MKFAARIGLYVLLLVLAAYYFGRFRTAYHSAPEVTAAASELSATNEVTPETNAVASSATTPEATNAAAAGGTSADATNAAPAALSDRTNAPAVTKAAAATPAPARKSDSLRSLGLFVVFFLALGGLAAWDVSQYLGSRAGRAVMAEDWIERKDPEYEKAEEEWSKGNHLDAIALMREYLAKNPQEQHVAIRIAEIYEKDLGNHLAAALELQEVLTKRLPKERWGWTAVRLANLYSGKLNQPDKAIALLQRIVNEYGGTAAAKKARSRLGIPEPVEAAPAAPADAAEAAVEETPEESTPDDPPPEPPSASNLPKGFRPRK